MCSQRKKGMDQEMHVRMEESNGIRTKQSSGGGKVTGERKSNGG